MIEILLLALMVFLCALVWVNRHKLKALEIGLFKLEFYKDQTDDALTICQ